MKEENKQKYQKEENKDEELDRVRKAFLNEGIGGAELADIMRRWEKEDEGWL